MENAPAVADLMGRDEILDTVCAAVTRGGGALVLGGSGTGKTALLKAAAGRLQQDFHTLYIRATALSSNTPYGALASLVARLPDAAGGPVRLLRGLDRSLAERSGGRPVLLAVDNADQLDRLSSMVLSQLLRRRSVSVAAAASIHWEAGHELMELWSEGLLARVDLEPLSERHTRRLMQQMLGGPVSSLAAASLWRESEGNPRFIHLLTRAQVRSGTLARRGPVWVRTQAPSQLGDVAEVADAVLDRLTEQERRLVEILALSVSLPLDTVLELVPSPVVDGLEERQIVRVDGPGPRVRFAGRSAGTAIALTMRPGRRRELWEAVSGRVDPQVLPPAELGAFTGWALSCGEVPGPVQLLRAAQAANTEGDARGALKLITAVPSGGRTQALVLEEARALRATGDLAGLVRLIRDAAPEPQDRATYVPLMQLYAFALARMQGAGDAGHVLSAAAASAPPGGDALEQQAVIAVGAASLAADYGSVRDAPAGLGDLAADPHLSSGTRFQLRALHAYTLALSGQGAEAVEALGRIGSPDGYPLTAGAAEEAWTRIFDTCILTGELERAAGFVKAFGDSGMRPSTRGSAGELAVAVPRRRNGGQRWRQWPTSSWRGSGRWNRNRWPVRWPPMSAAGRGAKWKRDSSPGRRPTGIRTSGPFNCAISRFSLQRATTVRAAGPCGLRRRRRSGTATRQRRSSSLQQPCRHTITRQRPLSLKLRHRAGLRSCSGSTRPGSLKGMLRGWSERPRDSPNSGSTRCAVQPHVLPQPSFLLISPNAGWPGRSGA